MSNLAKHNENGANTSAMESLLMAGNIAGMNGEQRIQYYNALCNKAGLSPITQPFTYMKLNGKEVLYCNKSGAEQLRQVHDVTIQVVREGVEGNYYKAVVRATLPNGRSDEEVSMVSIEGLEKENYCNAVMKTVTKAKRRVTLSICGLGMLDEMEVHSISDAKPLYVDYATGEVIEENAKEVPPPQQLAPAFSMTKERVAEITNAAKEKNYEDSTIIEYCEKVLKIVPVKGKVLGQLNELQFAKLLKTIEKKELREDILFDEDAPF
jgi:hypothetical protein